MKRFIALYLNFSWSERLGIFSLLSLLLLAKAAPYFMAETGPPVRQHALEEKLYLLMKEDTAGQQGTAVAAVIYRQPVYQLFDPNGLPEETWKKMGLKDWQVKMIRKYEAKGGRFRKKDDLKKMYCISPELYNKLEPYIHIPAEDKPAAVSPPAAVTGEKKTELNAADSATLERLPGIGSYTAARITRYRNRLGGFASVSQLKEIRGISGENFSMFSEKLYVDPGLVKKIAVNQVKAAALSAHPYLNRTQAEAIVNYRSLHGRFSSISDLSHVLALDTATIRKVSPYLSFTD